MVIDPWGTVIAQAPDGVGLVVADLDLDRLARIRQELPSLANRRLRDLTAYGAAAAQAARLGTRPGRGRRRRRRSS